VAIVGGYSRSGWANIILIEDLYGLKGLEFCQNPTRCFFLLCVYYISVIRQICWMGPPEYVTNRI
jgi:hypothetical protein